MVVGVHYANLRNSNFYAQHYAHRHASRHGASLIRAPFSPLLDPESGIEDVRVSRINKQLQSQLNVYEQSPKDYPDKIQLVEEAKNAAQGDVIDTRDLRMFLDKMIIFLGERS